MVRLKGRRESNDNKSDKSSPSPEEATEAKSGFINVNNASNGRKSPKKSPLLRRKELKSPIPQD